MEKPYLEIIYFDEHLDTDKEENLISEGVKKNGTTVI